jgi:hypothetical protein
MVGHGRGPAAGASRRTRYERALGGRQLHHDCRARPVSARPRAPGRNWRSRGRRPPIGQVTRSQRCLTGARTLLLDHVGRLDRTRALPDEIAGLGLQDVLADAPSSAESKPLLSFDVGVPQEHIHRGSFSCSTSAADTVACPSARSTFSSSRSAHSRVSSSWRSARVRALVLASTIRLSSSGSSRSVRVMAATIRRSPLNSLLSSGLPCRASSQSCRTR